MSVFRIVSEIFNVQ